MSDLKGFAHCKKIQPLAKFPSCFCLDKQVPGRQTRLLEEIQFVKQPSKGVEFFVYVAFDFNWMASNQFVSLSGLLSALGSMFSRLSLLPILEARAGSLSHCSWGINWRVQWKYERGDM